MASSLEDNLSCPVCCEIFRDPHMLSCGHTFCRQCISDHQPSRTCPVCLHCTLQNPVSNLVLRSTCESYRRRTLEEVEECGGLPCPRHGLKIRFFCKDHGEMLCKECSRCDHQNHKIQPLTQAVLEHKDQIRAALIPAEKALESLRKSSGLESRVSKYIKSQAKQTERQMKSEFEKLHQFLRVEEEARRSALRAEEQRKHAELEELVERDLQALSDRVMQVEEDLQNDDVKFMRNFVHVLSRAQYRLPKQHPSQESLIDVARHVGNLRFKVWEKMKDICPCYPVILDPNSASPDMTVSGDLTAVSHSGRRSYSPNPLLDKHLKFLVLGSEAKTSNYCWDVDIGDSKSWELGVCQRPLDKDDQQCLWGLGSNSTGLYTVGPEQVDMLYYLLYVLNSLIEMITKNHRSPKTIRMNLEQRYNNNNIPYWSLTITDRSSWLVLRQFHNIPFTRNLYPFLTLKDYKVPLSIVPMEVNITLGKQSLFLVWCFLAGLLVFVLFYVFL